MENIISNSISELTIALNLLKELDNNKCQIDIMDKNSKLNMKIKMICFSKNVELIKDNVICLLKDITNNKSLLCDETLELIKENNEVSIVINELLPYLLYYYFNRKSFNAQEVL